jgi:transcriptional regulator with XRE-family HTH domain
MKLSDKIRYLREVEGNLRGLNRSLTQQELVRAIQQENGSGKKASISQSYLSQIESGARPHLTNTTRMLLAKFFKVHPGYLVDDPEGYHPELLSDLRTVEDKLDLWLISGSDCEPCRLAPLLFADRGDHRDTSAARPPVPRPAAGSRCRSGRTHFIGSSESNQTEHEITWTPSTSSVSVSVSSLALPHSWEA